MPYAPDAQHRTVFATSGMAGSLMMQLCWLCFLHINEGAATGALADPKPGPLTLFCKRWTSSYGAMHIDCLSRVQQS